MQISFQFLVDLIKTMDQHRFGASLFLIGLLIVSLAVVAFVWANGR